jgi:3-hydroxyisobutyrate dehydrogenase-like beta-hydroxyacid dehydrogenase
MRITVFGLGEAGSLLAADLARAGADVHGYDPAPVGTPAGVTRHGHPGEAAAGSEIVLSVTAAKDCKTAFDQALDRIGADVVYADVATSTPDLKADLAGQASGRGIAFADVALMAPVPGKGLSTPALASGPGASTFADTVNPLGGRVTVLDAVAGEAAARKLLRSVIAKGLTSLVIEGLEAAEAHGSREWFWSHLVELITDADETLLRRLVSGTPQHVDRRLAEMEAARDFLDTLGVPPAMTTATVQSLRRVQTDGMPSGAVEPEG